MSTTNENGLVRKSSAPVSSASASSSSPSLAVSMRIGVQWPASRSAEHTRNPFIPGKHDVEDDGVVAAFTGPPEAVFPVRGNIDGETLRFETTPYRIGQARLVLYK